MLIVGVDENGLGFRNQRMLGPLVVSASAFRVKRQYDFQNDFFWQELKGVVSPCKEDESLVVCDSKTLFRSGQPATYKLAEATVLAFYCLLNEAFPGDFDHCFLSRLAVDRIPLQERCILKGKQLLCHYDSPFFLPAWGAKPDSLGFIVRALQEKLEEREIQFVFWKTKVFCPYMLNQLEEGMDKYSLEGKTIVDLARILLEDYPGEEVSLYSGKIDGWGVEKISRFLHGKFVVVSSCSDKDADSFIISSGGRRMTLRFVTAGDKTVFPIALSSILGKYVREIFIKRINDFVRSSDGAVSWCGGYRQDTRFDEFVRRAIRVLAKAGIPQECLLR